MAAYRFVTTWHLEAPITAVWDEIYASERWPEWWPSVLSVVVLQNGDDHGVGAVRRYTWRGALPYKLTFDMTTTAVEKPVRLEGSARGELSGRGCWTLADAGGATTVCYDWQVDANKLWMRVVSPLARRLFEWNHDVVMDRGLEGLRTRLTHYGKRRPAF
jgi:uncharacterized protein YndB with AHSA1/START domain